MSLFDLNQTCEIVLTQRRFIWNFCSTKLLCTCIEGLKSYKINQDIDVWRKLGWGIRKIQKQPPRSVPRKKCSENIQQIYKRTPMRECDFSKVAMQLYWNHTSTWCSPVNLLHIFKTPSPMNISGWLPLDTLLHPL